MFSHVHPNMFSAINDYLAISVTDLTELRAPTTKLAFHLLTPPPPPGSLSNLHTLPVLDQLRTLTMLVPTANYKIIMSTAGNCS